MSVKKSLILFILLLITPLLASAAKPPLEITSNKDSFLPGEEIKITAVFTDNYDIPLKGKIVCDISFPRAGFPPAPSFIEFDLKPGQSQEIKCGQHIDQTSPEGFYGAQVTVFDQNNTIIVSETKKLAVSGVKKSINAELSVCADQECKNPKPVFISGEKIFIKTNMEIQGFDPVASVKNLQTGEQKDLQFDRQVAILTAGQTGSYEINLKLNRIGYAEQILIKDFAVIDAPVKIKSEAVCQINGKCQGEENIKNCPQDCAGAAASNNSGIIIAVILILLGGSLIAFAIIKARNDRQSSN